MRELELLKQYLNEFNEEYPQGNNKWAWNLSRDFNEYLPKIVNRLEILENVIQHLKEEAKRSYQWHTQAGMKPASTPKINLTSAREILQILSVLDDDK